MGNELRGHKPEPKGDFLSQDEVNALMKGVVNEDDSKRRRMIGAEDQIDEDDWAKAMADQIDEEYVEHVCRTGRQPRRPSADMLHTEAITKDRWKNRRAMAWISLFAALAFPVLLLLTKSDQLGAVAGAFYLFVSAVVGAYIGFATVDDRWQRGIPPRHIPPGRSKWTF